MLWFQNFGTIMLRITLTKQFEKNVVRLQELVEDIQEYNT